MTEAPTLRFEIGARVECNCGQWMSGTVVKHWYREPNWPPTKKAVPYQVKLDHGPTIFAPADSDACIKRITGLLAVGQIPVTVLTGFLGAGKTTLLNYILTQQHGKKYAVIENEFGDVAIDNQLLAVKKADAVESITVLDNGCLCCTVRDDLVGAIQDIVKTVEARFAAGVKDAKLDGILIETTGMADPGPIIKTFGMDETVKKYCKIDGILTVVDCKHFLSQLTRERPPDAVNEPAQQVGFADKLLLNKVDACERSLIDETKQAIRGINTFVPIRECSLAQSPDAVPIGELLAIEAFDAAKMLTEQSNTKEVQLVCTENEITESGGHGGHGDAHGAYRSGHGGHGHDCEPDCKDDHGSSHGDGHGHGHGHVSSRHDTDVKSMVLEGQVIDMIQFQHWIADIIQQRSVDLYRYKGVLAVRDAGSQKRESTGKVFLYILQGVHDMPEFTFSGEWPDGKPIKTQVVLIGRKLDKKAYEDGFRQCCQT